VKYLLLIYGDESRWEEAGEEARAAVYREYESAMAEMNRRGGLQGGAELDSTDTATTVRVRDGETQLTDGPFAETKEALGGYFLVEAGSIDEAIEYAALIPTARYGSIEVRPLVER
jgi:hypothetical protein